MFQNILISVTRKTFTDVQLPLPRDKHLFFFFLILFWPHHMACGILVPQAGIESKPPPVEVQRLNPWTSREASQLPCWQFLALPSRDACLRTQVGQMLS